MDALKLTLSGDFGHFKRLEGAAIKQTHTIPTRTALFGLFGAIFGEERDSYYEEYGENISLAIIPDNIRRIQIPQLQLSTSSALTSVEGVGISAPDGTENRQQHGIEYLIDPKYTIFIKGPDKYLSELSNRIERNRYAFTPYLGTTECLARLTDPTTIQLTQQQYNPKIEVNSVVPEDDVQSVSGSEEAKVTFERMATNFKKTQHSRKPTGFTSTVVPLNNKPLIVQPTENTEVYQTNTDQSIIFL